MKIGELVKVNRKFVQDYGLIIDIFDIQSIQKIKVRFTDPDHVIMFGLMYDRAKEEKIF